MKFTSLFPNIAKSDNKNGTKAKVLLYILLFTLICNICLLINAKIGLLNSSFPFWTLIVGTIGLLVIFRFTDSLTITTNLFLAIFATLLAITSLKSGGVYSLDNFLLYIIPLSAYVLSEVRSAAFWLIVVNIWSFYLFTLAGSPEQIQLFREQTIDFPPAYYFTFCLVSTIASFMFLSIFYYENQNLIEKLEANQEALELKNNAYAQQTKQLEKVQERLKFSNRELEQYAYVTSHDLKQPIRTINGFANLLKRDLVKKEVLDDENTEYLNLIIKSSNNMQQLVTDLLAYAKLSAEEEVLFQELPLDDVLDNVLTNLQNQINSNKVTIERTQLPTLKVLPVKIHQVFQNIISNAIKFKKKQVPLTLKIRSQLKGAYWEFSIEDNGIGIEQKHQENIFALFRKLHSETEYSGSGIGLSTCQRIIQMHKGDIWVESEKGIGTKFIFTLPVAQNQLPPVKSSKLMPTSLV